MSDEKKQDSYFTAMIKFKILSTVFFILIILAVVAFFTTGVSSEKIFKAYTSLNTTNGSNMNSLKKLNFLSSYIKETGDLSILTKVGLASTEEEAKEILAEIEETLNPEEEEEEETTMGETITINTLSKEEWEKALAAKNHPYYKLGDGIKTISLPTGETFIYEVQGGAWNGVTYKGTNKQGQTVDIPRVSNLGCFEFAQSAAITALRKEIVGTEDVLRIRNIKGTFNLRWENNKWVDTTNDYGLGKRTDAHSWEVFDKYEISANEVGGWNNGKENGTVKELYDFLKKEGFDDCLYIVYFHTKYTCSGYCHWMCVYGIDNNGYIYVNNNASRDNPVDSNAEHGGPKANSEGKKEVNEVTTVIKLKRK